MSYGSSETNQISEGGFKFLGDSAGGAGILGKQAGFQDQMAGMMGQFSPEKFAQYMMDSAGAFGDIAGSGVERYRDQFMAPARMESMQAGKNISGQFSQQGGLFSGAFGKAFGQGVAEPFARAGSQMAGMAVNNQMGLMNMAGQGFNQRGQAAAGLFGQAMSPLTDVSQAVYEQPVYANESEQFSLL